MNKIEKMVFALVLLLPLSAAGDPATAIQDDPLPGGMIEGEIDGRVVTCPLLKTDMKAYIHGDVATVELTQTFTNPHEKPMHARYVFPLPPDAAVYAMRMRIGQRVIEAQIKRKEEAEQVFEQAKAEGKQAALLTQHRPDVFTQQVANLMPGDRILIELRYAHAVPKRDGVFRYHFPMVVGPRYVPEKRGAEGEPEPLELGQWNLPASAPVAPPDSVDPERVGIEVHLDAGMPVRWMDSNSHVIDVHEKGVGKRLIRLAAGRTIDNQDFVLAYALAGKKVTAGVTTWARNGKGVLSVLIEPPARAAASKITPREMVFVLDCSGSMHGVPLDTSKRFMRQALANLRPTDRFRIIRFSHTASGFAETPLPATEKNIRRGLEFIDSLSGSGGTEMTTGIRAALDPKPVPGALRIVVFLTDGYVGNDADIVRLIRQRRGTARLFSFGIGNAVNRYLLSEMARAGRGAARFVRPEEDPEKAADQLAERLDAPYLTDVRLAWEGASFSDPTPARLPDLFMGERLRILVRYDEPGAARLTVHGRIAGKAVQLPLEVELPADDPSGQALDVLWARGQIEDRMIDFMDPAAGQDRREKLEEEVIVLGLEHKLVTRWTSFVAVAREAVNPSGQADDADVAVPQVKGVSHLAYPQKAFFGSSVPEPEQWAAIGLLMLLALLWLRRP